MKLRKLALVPIAAAVMAIGTPAQAVTSVGGTVDGVVYTLSTLTNLTDNNTFADFTLTATGGYSLSGGFLNNVSIKVSDMVTLAGSTLNSDVTNWGTILSANNLNNNVSSTGCDGSGSGFLCSTAATPVAAPGGTYTFEFTVNKDGGNWIFPEDWHIGARYIDDAGKFQSLASIPEPEIYAMLMAGLGLMGFVARRRRQLLESGAA